MAAKQKHILRVKQRILEKLKTIDDQEEAHHQFIHDHVSKVKQQATELLQLEDSSQFLARYNRVIQVLDACYNNLELLTADAEDRLANDDAEGMYVDTFGLDTRSLADESTLHSPGSVAGYESFVCKDKDSTDKTLTHDEDCRTSTPLPSKDEQPKTFRTTPPPQAKPVTPVREGTAAKLEQSSGTSSSKDKTSPNDMNSSQHAFTASKQLQGASQTRQSQNIPVQQCLQSRSESVSESKQPAAIPKLYKHKAPKVPMEVKRQLTQVLESVVESDSSVHSVHSSQFEHADDSSAFEDKVTATSSPKKRNKKSKKKGKSNNSQTNTQISGPLKVEEDLMNTTKTSSDNGDNLAVDRVNEQEHRKINVDESKSIGIIVSEKNSKFEKDTKVRNDKDTHIDSATTDMRSFETKEENVRSESDGKKVESSKLSEGARQDVTEHFQEKEKPRITQGTLLERDATPVIVSEIINPWCFYVQRCCTSLNGLMEEICNYMSTVGLTEKPLSNPEEGVICLALYSRDNLYYRALITKIYKGALNRTKMPYFKNRSPGSYPYPDEKCRDADSQSVTEVDVIFIDYGNRERVKAHKLRVLPDHLTLLPAQAICCALAEVMPCNKYNEWREEDIFTFNQYVLQKQLECVPVGRSSGKNMPNLVRLFMYTPMPAVAQATLYMNKICISTMLVSGNLAKEVPVTDQVRMIMKFMEDMGDFVFSLGNENSAGVEIKELTESPVCGSGVLKKLEGPMKANVTLDLKKDVDGTEMEPPKEDRDQVNEMQTEDNVKSDRSLISPRSESSDTESQKDVAAKDADKNVSTEVSKEAGNVVNLPGIKEEAEIDTANASNVERAVSDSGSIEMLDTISSITEPDMSDSRSVDTGFHSSDFNLNLDQNPQGQTVMLAHVKSPGLFYVHIVSKQVGSSLDRLMKCLNQQFEKMTKRDLTKLSKTLKPVVNKMVCAQFLEDNCFYRAVIKQLPPEKDGTEKRKGKYHVYYVDFGDDQWVPASRLFPLPEPFVYFPPLVVKCSLAYVKPVSEGKEGETATWSEKATETFVAMATFEKKLLMHVVHGSLSADRKGELVGEDNTSVGVLLIDSNGAEEVCINMDLIRQGLAELDAANAVEDTQELPEAGPSDTMDSWNPMEEDFYSVRNSYNIDVDDAGVATTGYKAQDEKRICKFYNRGSCWRGERCPRRHVKSDSGVTMDQEALYFVYNNQETLLPDVHCWVAMEVSTILTPGHFYAILPMGNRSLDGTSSKEGQEEAFGEMKDTETLDDLLASLNEEYSHRGMHEGTLILRAPGEIVAARYNQDQQWYRARVLQSTEEKVKVFYLDFGNTEWILARDTFEILPQFLHLPFQAIECFLHNVEPVGETDIWSKESKSGFRELVDGKTLVGHVKSKSWNGCIWIELYDTTSERDVNIADALVEKGFAIRAQTFTETTMSDASASIKSEAIRSDGKSSVVMIPG